MTSYAWLRRQAVGWAFPPPGTLTAVLKDLEFVQADPIRSPARAQDLILRQRVSGYRAGDLDRHYPQLEIDEEQLYAYGFASQRLRPYLHPRRNRHAPDGQYELVGRAAEVLEFVRDRGVTHPREVQDHFGHVGVDNGWGGKSSATTLDLEELRHYGHLRVADRVAGIRRYEVAPPLGDPLDPDDRVRALTLLVARILAPVPLASLGSAVNYLIKVTRAADGKPGGRPAILDLLARGELEAVDVGGTRYVWPAELTPVQSGSAARVRILAPFDPVVWDRRRFGEIWGWDYRFEAYTPEAKRIMGYYAMPLLWRDQVIGWANCAGAGQAVEVGYVDRAPTGTAYAKALEAEIGRLRVFLGPA